MATVDKCDHCDSLDVRAYNITAGRLRRRAVLCAEHEELPFLTVRTKAAPERAASSTATRKQAPRHEVIAIENTDIPVPQ